MSLYSDSEYPVAAALEELHARQLDALGEPGTWFTGIERVALAEEVRAARIEAGVQEADGVPAPVADGGDLSPAAKRVAREVAVSPGTIVREFYDQALEDGLTAAEYVEVVGVTGRVVNMDVIARGIGLGPRAIGTPREGDPSGRRPAAVAEGAWVDTVPSGPPGGDDAKELYGEEMMYFIYRALSLVPPETHAHLETDKVQYLPSYRFAEFDYQHHEALTRPQVEVIAGRVSAVNECFY